MPRHKTHFDQVALAEVLQKIGKNTSTGESPTQDGLDHTGNKNQTNQAGRRHMTQQFDIFRKEPDGGVLWRGTAASIEEARTAIAKFGAAAPGSYLIVNLQARTQVTIDCAPGMLS